MRTDICGQNPSNPVGFFNVILNSDSSLFNVIKSVRKGTDNVGKGTGSISSNISFTNDYVFLPSEYEVFGRIVYSNNYELNCQHQYAYFSSGNDKRKRRYNATSSLVGWWLRSPYLINSRSFVEVDSYGGNAYARCNNSLGFAPCFCV